MSISQILGLSPQNVYSMATAAIRSQDSCISQCTNTETQTHYLILLWFVREVAQAVGGEVSMGSSWATCKKK